MRDATTESPIQVYADGDAGPYILVDLTQLDAVQNLLRQHRVSFWTDDNAVSLDGEPAVAIINLGRGSDAVVVQRLLDAA